MFDYVMHIIIEELYKEFPAILVLGWIFTVTLGNVVLAVAFMVLMITFVALANKYLEKYGSAYDEEEEA